MMHCDALCLNCSFSVNALHVPHIVSRQRLAVRLSLSFLSCPHKVSSGSSDIVFQYHVIFGETCSLGFAFHVAVVLVAQGSANVAIYSVDQANRCKTSIGHRAENRDRNSLQGSRVGAVRTKKRFDQLARSLHEILLARGGEFIFPMFDCWCCMQEQPSG